MCERQTRQAKKDAKQVIKQAIEIAECLDVGKFLKTERKAADELEE